MTPASDHLWMARALRLAEKGRYTTDPNPRVGCVLVKDGRVVGEGWHRRAGGPHAEIEALKMAGEAARGADCYVTLEPCCHHGRTPPCTEALIKAGISRVVAAMADPNPRVAGGGLKRLQADGIEAVCGVLETEAEALNRGFVSRHRRGRPWVTAKLAASLDGRTALASGESKWITSPQARADVHRLRAGSSAVLTGIGTVLADNPRLDARLGDTDVVQPLRVVVDSRLRMPPTARMLDLPGRTLIACCHPDPARRAALEAAGAEIWVAPIREGRVDLAALLEELARREVNEVLVEAGSTLNGALAAAGLVDEWVIYLAPCLLGDEGRGLFHLPGIGKMADRIGLRFVETRRIGPDLRIKVQPR
ncbi:diaminohydroxyphosphoribosylaminopyrimidine deaminase/5-amino-6-(5-phosphoribosylamino)uracil reductase [Methylomarinovum caldicuralii]|uniref:Riboflavin biosynthesis protein RibD n=1 Tax=Methylomarinovum caldicuralii TaxID=438856 RepID=A0AAU9C3M0_9GAMM|nr:bifunctional diaminohydroxyphosphoribosylaminopyrimidine deaminase/5-amino-6-(5-phosphoribosylamino)uracil reductase RibD [Methylomarinovum caldicuralii]BCX81810.1 diaminohydroxyphosphoribosylaminopyrimidine deaminase/5-amino-6-(5-phosphoribosylamino)uracil reductase [Methylomarinovum caldicuralii]